MYQDYIDGKRELREINMDFQARYVSGDEAIERQSCGYMKQVLSTENRGISE